MSHDGKGQLGDGVRRFKRYPAYKDSDTDWIGDIPADWPICKLKYLTELRTDKASERLDGDFRIALENVESWTGRFIETESEFEGDGIRFQESDILFGKLRPYLAKVLEADRQGVAVGEFFVIAPGSKCDSRFLFYRMLSKPFIDVVDGSTYGAKMPRANWEFIGNLMLATPTTLDEQRKIAAFLDRETAKIDALVAKMERLIELLQEKRTALISHAVTKGLDPNVPMKDSGIEWLGQIPAHWKITTVNRVISFITSSVTGLPLTRLGSWRNLVAEFHAIQSKTPKKQGFGRYRHEPLHNTN